MGATANHEGEARVDQQIADSAKKVVVVTTADKIGSQAFARICRPNQIDAIITDRALPAEMKMAFENQGVEIIVC